MLLQKETERTHSFQFKCYLLEAYSIFIKKSHVAFSVKVSIISILLYMINFHGIFSDIHFQICSSTYHLLGLWTEYCARYREKSSEDGHSALRELIPNLEEHHRVLRKSMKEFPGGTVLWTWHFHCQGPGSGRLVRELRSCKPHGTDKNK